MQRIRREGAVGGPSRNWRMGISAAVVAVAFLLVVGQVDLTPPPPATPQPPPEIPPVTQPQTRPAGGGDTIPLPGQEVSRLTVKATLLDQSGNAVVFDADGYDVAPAPSGIPGVEARPGQKIVLNAEYTLEVADAHRAMEALQAMALNSGGYAVEATLNQDQSGAWAGRLLLRIPSAQFAGAASQVVGTGKVKHQRQWAQDVTDQYQDLESRLKVLQEHEQKLQELALKAANFDEWLRLAREINEVRIQLENLQGSLKQLANKVEYSTLNIGLIQPAPGAVAVEKGEGLGREMWASFTGSMTYLGSLGRSFLIGVAAVLPVVVPLALVTLWFLFRQRRRASHRPESPE